MRRSKLLELMLAAVLLAAAVPAGAAFDPGVQPVANIDEDQILTSDGGVRFRGAGGWVSNVEVLAIGGEANVYFYRVDAADQVTKTYGPYLLSPSLPRAPLPYGAKVDYCEAVFAGATKVIITPIP